MDGTRTDRKRVKNETGSGSPSVGAVTRRSGVGDFSGEAEESDGFGSSPERGPLGGEKGFSLLASVEDMVDATRRDGRRLYLSQACSASISMPGPESDMPTPLHVESATVLTAAATINQSATSEPLWFVLSLSGCPLGGNSLRGQLLHHSALTHESSQLIPWKWLWLRCAQKQRKTRVMSFRIVGQRLLRLRR